MPLTIVKFSSYRDSVKEALDRIDADKIIAKQTLILVKPNLVNASPHPVTTSPDCCEAVIEYIRACSKADIVIAEGCGDAFLETDEVFGLLGYRDLAKRHAIELIDLNHAPLKKLQKKNFAVFPEIHLPEILFRSFIISLPVLKVHSLCDFTGTLKNMIGCAPPQYYSGQYGTWKKAAFHQNLHRAIMELNSYRSPDLSIIDGSIGLAEYHLGGAQCDPPINKIIAGFDPLEVDRHAAELLGLNWKKIHYLAHPLPP